MVALKCLPADLHIHTVLSACAEIEMIPPLIVQRALDLGLKLVAITDHNSAANASAVIEAAQGYDLTVLPGIEVQSREEAHLLCLFDTIQQANECEQIVTAALPVLENNEAFFGAQYVVDRTGEYRYTENRLLATSLSLSVEQIVSQVHALGGLCIPAHIDRPAYSLISNLGFIPPQLPIIGVELSSQAVPKVVLKRFPQLSRYGLVIDGDAHRLSEMIARMQFYVESPTIPELRLALTCAQDRRVQLD